MRKLVVNGVDGNFGSVVAEVIQTLVTKEELVFTAPVMEKLNSYKEAGINTAITNFNSKEQLVPVFMNADKVLLISMPFVGEKRRAAHKNVVDACVEANVKQIVYISLMDATNPMNPSVEKVDHGYTESYIQRCGLDYIFLRNSQYAEAMLSVYNQAVADGSFTLSNNMGDGKVAYISRKDCATAAAYAVANTLLHKEILNINGLQNLTITEFIEIGNKVSGNDVKYHELSDDEMYHYFDNLGVPRTTDGTFDKNSPWQFCSEGMVTFGEAIRLGYMSVHTKDFLQLTGRHPLSVEYMFKNAPEFQVGNRNSVDE